MKQHFNLKETKKLPDSEVEITGEITLPFLVELRKEALKHLNSHTELPGFRPGKIPEEVLVRHVGEMRVLEETAELALGREYAQILAEAKVSPIGKPEISITKLAPGIPLEFKITLAVEPEFELPDYKKLSKETLSKHREEKAEVSEKEVSDTVAELEKRGIKPELKEGEKLEDKVRESLEAEKKSKEQEKRRLSLIEALVKETEIKLPKALIEAELAKMLAQFRDDVLRMGMKWDEYLKQAKKTEEEIQGEWQDQARDRVKAEIIISKIAQREKIEPAESEVEHEAAHLLEHFPDADPLRARIYIYTQLRNQKVLEFLEAQA